MTCTCIILIDLKLVRVLQNECIVTTDRDYLGNGNVDLFDALVIQIRFFLGKNYARIANQY